MEELPNHTSVRSITEDNEAVEVIYDESSLWLSGGSSYIPETNTEPSLPSMKFTKKFFWYLSLCEMCIITTDKVEVNTTNYTIKTIYDEAHSEIKTGNIKNTNLDIRLRLSGLFSSVDYKPQPISVRYIAEQAIFSPLTTQNIKILTSAIQSNELLRLDHSYTTMEELAINHILTDVYLKTFNIQVQRR